MFISNFIWILESNYEKKYDNYFFSRINEVLHRKRQNYSLPVSKSKHVFLHNSFQYFNYILYWIGLNIFLKLSLKLNLFHCEDIYKT